jgi:hypothetical protein
VIVDKPGIRLLAPVSKFKNYDEAACPREIKALASS